MATTRTTTRVTADDLFRMDENARFELIEGELVEMSPPGGEHARVAADVVGEVRNHIRRNRLPLTYGNESGFLLARDPDTVLAPDGSIVAQSDEAAWRSGGGYSEVVPLLVVEVVSPSNRAGELHRKVDIYLAAGVRIVWVVDSERRRVTVYRADGSRAELHAAAGDELDGGDVLPGFRLPLSELFPA